MGLLNRSPRVRSARFPKPRRRGRRSLPALEWAADAAGRFARITSFGSRSLLVESHTGILSFSEDYVRLNTAGGPMCVRGSGLTLRDARPGALIVRGSIRALELPCREGGAPDEG